MEPSTDSLLLGGFEFRSMNNPLRRWRQKHQELPLLLEMLQKADIELTNQTIMDLGCGSGYGTKLLIEALAPARVFAYDLMPEQIALAKKRQLAVDFQVGDATAMTAPDASCKAVFDFGVLHHIPRWETALAEGWRVLSPGGVLFIEEPHKLFSWEELEQGIMRQVSPSSIGGNGIVDSSVSSWLGKP